jgi:hypothetical protein
MPAHIQEKQFHHPHPNLRLIQVLQKLSRYPKPSFEAFWVYFEWNFVSLFFLGKLAHRVSCLVGLF